MRRDVRNDAIHPLLSKGRPLAQLHIDELERGPGRPRYGPVTVQEVPSRTALTEFMGGGRSDPMWSLNPYAGCQHACTYCYVPKTIHAERERWGQRVLVKTDLPRILRHELRHKTPARVQLSTATDPYQSVEAEHRITRRCLEQLLRADWPIDILTRSPLVLRDLDLLKQFTNIRVGLSIPTLDDPVRAAIEPAAPPIEARLHALKALRDAGLSTYANLAPAYPLTNHITPTFVAETLRDMGAQWVNISPWRYLRETLRPIRRRLRATGRTELEPFITDETRQTRLRRTFEVAFERAGLPLRVGFFNSPGAPPTLDSPSNPAVVQ